MKWNNWYSTRQRIIVLDFESEENAAAWDREVGADPEPDYIGLHLSDDLVKALTLRGGRWEAVDGGHCDE